jgi:pimeloyl-ACP methyl ester carboxylesterase
MTVLVVCGEDDTAYGDVCTRAARSIGTNARLAFVPGAGHAAHLEQPDAFTVILRSFLAGIASRASAHGELARPDP